MNNILGGSAASLQLSRTRPRLLGLLGPSRTPKPCPSNVLDPSKTIAPGLAVTLCRIRHEEELIKGGALEAPNRVESNTLVRTEYILAGALVEIVFHLNRKRPRVCDREPGIR